MDSTGTDDKATIRSEIDTTTLNWIPSSDTEPGIEIAHTPGGHVAMRNPTDPTGPLLVFTPAEWDAFVHGAKDGEFDQP